MDNKIMHQNTTEWVDDSRIGTAVLKLSEGDTVKILIESEKIEPYTTKKGKVIDFVQVTNLEDGESELKLWVGGGLKKGLNTILMQEETLQGVALRITHKGYKTATVVVNGSEIETEVAQYEIFRLKKKTDS